MSAPQPETGQPPPALRRCLGCKRPFQSASHWFAGRWTYAGICLDCWAAVQSCGGALAKVAGPDGQPVGALPAAPFAVSIPERYRHFDPDLAPPGLRELGEHWIEAQADAGVRHLAIVGPPGTGKSRALWAFVADLSAQERARPKAFEWEDFAFETLDRTLTRDLATHPWAVVDNVGSVALFPSVLGAVRAALRLRLNHGRRTFLSIDDPGQEAALLDGFGAAALVIRP